VRLEWGQGPPSKPAWRPGHTQRSGALRSGDAACRINARLQRQRPAAPRAARPGRPGCLRSILAAAGEATPQQPVPAAARPGSRRCGRRQRLDHDHLRSAPSGGGLQAAGRHPDKTVRQWAQQLHPHAQGTEGACWPRRARMRWPHLLLHQQHQPAGRERRMGFSRRPTRRSSSGPVMFVTECGHHLGGGGQGPAKRVALRAG